MLACFFIVAFAALSRGLLLTPAMLSHLQSAIPGPALVSLSDLRYNAAFKLSSLARRRPDVISIGTSRIGTLREEMLEPYRFYNLSFTAWTTEQLLKMFDIATRDNPPRVAIVELDYFQFVDRWASDQKERDMIFGNQRRYIEQSIGDFAKVLVENPGRIISRAIAYPLDYFGPRGLLVLEGFRRDGSYSFGTDHIAAAKADQTAKAMLAAFPGGQRMAEPARKDIEAIARLAHERGITLIAVHLPFLAAGITYLDTDTSYHDYAGVWREFGSEATRTWLSSLGITFFDMSRFRLDDEADDFIDSSHLSEQGMRKLMSELSRQPEFRAILPAMRLGAAPQSPCESSASCAARP
jgi:hypothetical protein